MKARPTQIEAMHLTNAMRIAQEALRKDPENPALRAQYEAARQENDLAHAEYYRDTRENGWTTKARVLRQRANQAKDAGENLFYVSASDQAVYGLRPFYFVDSALGEANRLESNVAENNAKADQYLNS